jgi:hypothetical protein
MAHDIVFSQISHRELQPIQLIQQLHNDLFGFLSALEKIKATRTWAQAVMPI